MRAAAGRITSDVLAADRTCKFEIAHGEDVPGILWVENGIVWMTPQPGSLFGELACLRLVLRRCSIDFRHHVISNLSVLNGQTRHRHDPSLRVARHASERAFAG